jgi:D-alanyl-D-alanine carboxypeptidase
MFEPGTRFAYGNSDYFVLGLVIEKLVGTSLAEFFSAQMFGLLGMRHTGIEGYAGISPVPGYTEDPDLQAAPQICMSTPFAAGALVSTIDDMYIWERHMARMSLLSATSWQRMCAPTRLLNGEFSGYGYGLENRCIHGVSVVDHDGGISGFTSYSARVVDSGLFICVLTNNDSACPSPIEVGENILQTISTHYS